MSPDVDSSKVSAQEIQMDPTQGSIRNISMGLVIKDVKQVVKCQKHNHVMTTYLNSENEVLLIEQIWAK